MKTTASVLLVEDDRSIRETLELVLRVRGYEVIAAENGKEALQYLGAGNAPLVVLFDLMMPIMDGWDFAEKVRNDPAMHSLRLIAMTAFGESGRPVPQADRVLRKPLRLSELIEILDGYREQAA